MNFGRQGHSGNDAQRLFDCYVVHCIAELKKEPRDSREALLAHMTEKRDDAEMVKKAVFQNWSKK